MNSEWSITSIYGLLIYVLLLCITDRYYGGSSDLRVWMTIFVSNYWFEQSHYPLHIFVVWWGLWYFKVICYFYVFLSFCFLFFIFVGVRIFRRSRVLVIAGGWCFLPSTFDCKVCRDIYIFSLVHHSVFNTLCFFLLLVVSCSHDCNPVYRRRTQMLLISKTSDGTR